MWFAVHETLTGRLLSIGEADLPPVRTGYTSILLAGPIDLSIQMWDETTRTFVPRPPRVFVDRLDDLLTSPVYSDLQTAYNGLNPANRARVRDALIRLLGGQRLRKQSDAVTL